MMDSATNQPVNKFSTSISDDGFTEVLIAAGCASAIIASWILGVLLIFFPRHDQETYRRRLVANMPRARDEILPAELQLQTAIENMSTVQSKTLETVKENDGQKEAELPEEAKPKEDAKGKKKEKTLVPKLGKPEKPGKNKDKPAEKKPSKDVPKKEDKKPSKDAKAKEKNKKKK